MVLSSGACVHPRKAHDARGTEQPMAPWRAGPPRTILARGNLLVNGAQLVTYGGLAPIRDALFADAKVALRMAPRTVMEKTHLPPSGDRHDYMSLAPYWWPDTTKPGGLPYIRRDGVVNPDSRTDHDGTRFEAMSNAVEALAMEYFVSGTDPYAERATAMLRAWFIDPATRMKPNLNYAQAVLGVNEGRGTGIIDTRGLPQLLDAVRLLDSSPRWTPADRAGIERWMRDYLDWLRTSKNGLDEAKAQNNHGTWYDAQVAALALFVGDSALARETIGRSAEARLDAQIEPDGRQPLELARTRPLHYSLFNLDAFTQLAEMGRHVGVDLWHYHGAKGGSLGAAIAWVAPYADSTVHRDTPDVMPVLPEVFSAPLRRAAYSLGDPRFSAALAKLPASVRAERSRLGFPVEEVR
jgi:hypothetical protein